MEVSSEMVSEAMARLSRISYGDGHVSQSTRLKDVEGRSRQMRSLKVLIISGTVLPAQVYGLHRGRWCLC